MFQNKSKVDPKALSFAEEAFFDGVKDVPKYLDPKIISATSVDVESLFSVAKFVFDDRRLATTPEHVEQIMFLKENHFLWDLQFFTLQVYNENDDDDDDEIFIDV